jgi:uncharacterized protein (TIGR03435 family)
VNAIQMLSSEPWVGRLGWTLIHFVWQGLAIAVLYEAARQAMGRASSPNARYLLACAALVAMMAVPLATWVLMQPSHAGGLEASNRMQSAPPSAPITVLPTLATALPASVRATVSAVQPSQALSWIVMVWIAGAAVSWVRLAGGWVVASRMRSMLVRPAPPEWQEILRKLGAGIGLSRPVRLLVSALAPSPAVIGWLRPVVLAPVGAFSGLPAEHLEALLLHELAHIRRHDYLVNLLQSIAEALLFYQPAVWWISGHIRAERELCCDDVAVSVTGNALTYARALADLESYRAAHLRAAVAANGGSLSDRIARLLGQPRPTVRAPLGTGVLAVAILLSAAAYGLFGQSAAHFAFQSVSIEKSTSKDPLQAMGVSVGPDGWLIAKNASLMLLIQFAYAIHDDPRMGHWVPLLASQVLGGPAWINSTRYVIEAKPKGNTDPNQEWLMLQALLADRFKLTLHGETRELPIYDLAVAKTGAKLPPAKEAGCISFPPGTKPRPVPGKVDCGYVSGPFGGSGKLQMEGRKIRVADLVKMLALILDRPVLDKTGFAGEFDLNLSFTANDALMGMPPGYGGPTDPNRPNIFAALEEQLGLKLVPAEGPVEILVVDHVEMPATN